MAMAEPMDIVTGIVTGMTGGMTMSDPRLLTLMQWLSPAYPLGSFAYSHGLEAAVAEGWVRDGASLRVWLEDVICTGTGRTDAIWIRRAYEARDLEALNAEARAYAPCATRLRESERQGAAFVATTNAIWASALPPLLLPLAIGAAGARADLDLESLVPLALLSFGANLCAAAQRLLPLGQTEAQQILADLHPACLSAALTPVDALPASNAFLSDIAAMRQDTLNTRLFQS